MSAFHDSALVGASGQQGYQISRSLRFNSADSAYLNRTPASAGNRKTYTISMWVKRAKLGATARLFGAYSTGSAYFEVAFTSSDTLQWYYWNGSGYSYNRVTTQVFRDPSAWCHLVFVFNSPSATASQRIRIYFNGQEITTFSSSTDPTQNFDCLWNSTSTNVIADLLYAGSPGSTFDGMMTEIHHIDGQALTPSSFGETDTITGVWKPKKYAGTYGTNGFYLNFSDNSGTTSTTLGKDSSGNSNNWTPNNFSVTAGAGNDSLIDTPTPYADGGNGRGNYCTWNPLDSNSSLTLTNGNLDAANTSNSHRNARGTIAFPASGKWYYEVTVTGGNSQMGPGISASNQSLSAQSGGQIVIYTENGNIEKDGSVVLSGKATYTTNDVIGVAFDCDSNSVTFYKNNASQGSVTPTTGRVYFPHVMTYNTTCSVNFGQRPFAYTPPSGFVALNTQNLPEPSIKKPSAYMDVVTYTGNGAASGRNISTTTNPSLAWIKSRSIGTGNHFLFDSVRGAINVLGSNQTIAEYSNSDFALGTGEFTVGDNGGSDDYNPNKNASTYVAWLWNESATPGFDIVTYTGNGTGGTTINHSLGVAPSMVIIKSRSVGTNWYVWHKSLTQPDYQIYLNLTDAQDTSVLTFLNDKAPTSTVFELPGAGYGSNNSSATYVAYLWSEVAGFSKFGSYSSNGSSDGPYVHCGFRPKAVWIKKATGTTNANSGWCIFDSTRSTYNTTSANLRADLSDAESTFSALDFTSTGFKLRVVSIEVNGATSGDTYIFCAWAETPAKFALAR